MKIDFEHYKGAQIADDIQNNLMLESKLNILKTFSPKLSKDGNQFCFLYGEMPNDCIVGFGSTASDAMEDFVKNFYTQKA